MAGSPLRRPITRQEGRFAALHTVSTPYTWTDITRRSSSKALINRYVTDMCRPALNASHSELFSISLTSSEKSCCYSTADTTLRPQVPRIRTTAKPRFRAFSPQTSHMLRLGLDSVPVSNVATQALPYAVHVYARPHSRRSPIRAWQRREEVKNKVIDDYLGRFDRKRGPNLAVPQEQPRPMRLTRMVNVSVQQSEAVTKRTHEQL